jgi:hypothetical protein
MSYDSSDGKHVYAPLKSRKIIVILSVMVSTISLTYPMPTILGVPRAQ